MAIQIFEKTGKSSIGSRLRLLTARLNDDAIKVYESNGIDFVPKWFPVFVVLAEGNERTITEIANEIGHSQPSVSKIIREMTKAGLVKENQKSTDKRRNQVALTKKGLGISDKLALQVKDVEAAVEGVLAGSQNNLWDALAEWELLLDQQSMFKRVEEERKKRESSAVQIVPYKSKYAKAFLDLNEEWISKYFSMEESDYKALDHPKSYILDKGGKIFVALLDDEPVGVCALIRMDDPDYQFELAKMAVSPKAQGKNIGWLLGKTVIEESKLMGAKKLYLGSNTILKPAISLYYKLGFKKITGRYTPYKRCNFQMELDLK